MWHPAFLRIPHVHEVAVWDSQNIVLLLHDLCDVRQEYLGHVIEDRPIPIWIEPPSPCDRLPVVGPIVRVAIQEEYRVPS